MSRPSCIVSASDTAFGMGDVPIHFIREEEGNELSNVRSGTQISSALTSTRL